MRSMAAALEEAMKKKGKVVGQSMVGPGFPGMGTIQPSFQGSQSMSPDKLDNYTDTNMNVPSIDRGAYGPGY